jgi:hypothetical protein
LHLQTTRLQPEAGGCLRKPALAIYPQIYRTGGGFFRKIACNAVVIESRPFYIYI